MWRRVSMTEDRVVPSFISRSSPGFLSSLVAMLSGVMTIAPCCGGDYQGQNHRQRDAKKRPSYVWIGRKRVRWMVLYLDHGREIRRIHVEDQVNKRI
jgi:hypothetical protein